MSELDFDEFLDHSGTASGGGFLKNWKEDGSIVIWLHPKSKIHSRWGHRFPTVVVKEGVEEIKSGRFNCLEAESVNKKSRFRHRDGSREYPPEVCPHCLLVEWIREQVDSGELSWTDKVFHFEDDADEVDIHAGGITNLFSKREKTTEEKKELKRAGIKLTESFKESGLPGMDYVFCMVSHTDPGDGCVIATEKQSIGKKLQKVVKDRMDEFVEEGEDRNLGHPLLNPYAFKLSFDDNKDFSDKYDVLARPKIEITPEIQKVFDEDPPEVSRLVALPDVNDLRAQRIAMEEAACIDMPFDDFFKPYEEANGVKINGVSPESGEEDGDSEDEEEEATVGEVKEDEDELPESWNNTGSSEPSAAPAAIPEDEAVPCDKCGAAMHFSADKCDACGAEYVENEEGELVLKPDPPPAKRRMRRKS